MKITVSRALTAPALITIWNCPSAETAPAVAAVALAPTNAASAINLRCGYLTFPLWVDAATPRLRWVPQSPRRGWKTEANATTYNITNTANTTARITLFAQNAAQSKESGGAASQAPGVKLARMENGVAVFEASAGTYQFVGGG